VHLVVKISTPVELCSVASPTLYNERSQRHTGNVNLCEGA